MLVKHCVRGIAGPLVLLLPVLCMLLGSGCDAGGQLRPEALCMPCWLREECSGGCIIHHPDGTALLPSCSARLGCTAPCVTAGPCCGPLTSLRVVLQECSGRHIMPAGTTEPLPAAVQA